MILKSSSLKLLNAKEFISNIIIVNKYGLMMHTFSKKSRGITVDRDDLRELEVGQDCYAFQFGNAQKFALVYPCDKYDLSHELKKMLIASDEGE